MAFCGNCGAQVQDGVKFCPTCGKEMNVAPVAPEVQAPPPVQAAPPVQAPPVQAPPPAQAQQWQQPPQQQWQQPPQQQWQQQPPQPPRPPQSLEEDVAQNKGMAILAYIIFFVPLIAGTHKTSPYVKYHTNQGTVLAIFALIYSIAFWILFAILALLLWRIWAVLSILSTILSLVPLVLMVLGIINAAGGKMVPLPVIGKFNIIK